MTKLKLFITLTIFTILLINCKNSENNAGDTTSREDSINTNKYMMEPGEVLVPDDTTEKKFRPTLPLEQAAFAGSGKDESRLKNEYEFMFDKTWQIKGRVIAGDDSIHRKKEEIYNFNRDGSYKYSVDGVQGTGTWKGWMNDQVPVITVFPADLNQKVSEWNVKNTGKTMIWSGTSSYKDNAVMIQYVIK